jgi:hypothetical protein
MDKYKDISITWEGDVTSTSGWARHARGLLRPLIEGGAQVKLLFKKPSRHEVKLDVWWEEQFKIASKASPGLVHIIHGNPFNPGRNPNGGPTVLFTHWETEDVPKGWVKHINENFSALVVPSIELLTKKTKAQIKIPCYAVPCPIQETTSNNVTDIVGLGKQSIVFGAAGQWNQRRNMSDLILAYISTFNKVDNVALVLKTFGTNPQDLNEKNKIKSLISDLKRAIDKPQPPAIVLLQDSFSEQAFDSIINRINIYACSTRGDSKDITMQKCAALGKQCIYTNSLMHKEFTALDSSLLYPVDFFNEPVIQMQGTYTCDDYWSRPSVQMLCEQMRRAHTEFLTRNLKADSKDLIKKTKDKWSATRCLDPFKNLYDSIVQDIQVLNI